MRFTTHGRHAPGRAAGAPVAGDWIFAERHPGLDAFGAAGRPAPAPRGAIERRATPSSEDPEAELVRRVRAAAPTRRVLCALAARAIELQSWSRLGFARAGDQTRERHGLSARSLQELARVHRVLAEAPGVDAAFQTGRIGWTAARALARLERIEDEALWLGRAKALSAPELERAVRRAREERDGALPGPSENVDAASDARVPLTCTPLVRAKWSLGRELARRVVGGRLPSWECAEVLAAEASSAAPPGGDGPSDLDEEARPGTWLGGIVGASRPAGEDADGAGAGRVEQDRGPSAAGSVPPAASTCADPPRLSQELAPLLEGLAEADAFDVDRRLRRALRLERTHEARIGPLLRRVLEERRYRRRGYWDRDRYLEERLGMCPRKARALVRIERIFGRASALAGAYRSGRLSWVQAQALAPLVEAGLPAEHARAWVERAERITVRRLEDDVRGALALADLDPARFARTGGVPEEGLVKDPQGRQGNRQNGAGAARPAEGAQPGAIPREWIRRERRSRSRQTRARREADESACISFSAPPDSARFFLAVLEEVRQRLAAAREAPVTQGEALEAMLDHAIRTWSERDEHARRELRILERDGWRCAVPGCSSHRNLQVHHIVFRSRGGDDEPENLITLCAWHHQRGVHGGLVRITGRAPDRLRFELGLRDGEPPWLVYDSEERILDPELEPGLP